MVSYGGNLRFNTFDLSIAPEADNRTEFGGYVQDEIFLSNYVPAGSLGARVDRFDYLDDFVFSPRTTFLIKPRRRTRRSACPTTAPIASPSVINNFLDLDHRSADQPAAVQPGAGRPDLPAAGQHRRATRI